jgi:hypothetical protein
MPRARRRAAFFPNGDARLPAVHWRKAAVLTTFRPDAPAPQMTRTAGAGRRIATPERLMTDLPSKTGPRGDRHTIAIRGAREHNLKNIDVTIPRDQLVVFTGLSGSGKSSLAFDTIYAEGQRRYVESLSAYARQFLGQMEKPSVDQIEGLSPAVSIDQRGVSHNPRSTVGTATEIYDYLRLLFARIGIPHCPQCGRVISQQSAEQIVDSRPGRGLWSWLPWSRTAKGTISGSSKTCARRAT